MITNYNLASMTNFKLEIPQAENINYFLQTCNIPGISMPATEIGYLNYLGNVPSNSVTHNPLLTTILLDEDFENYLFLHDWILIFRDQDVNFLEESKDIKLHILTANKKSNLIFTFTNAFPTDLSDLNFDSSMTDVVPLTFTCTFAYQYYTIEKNET